MTHKTFQLIGERIIIKTREGQKIGIFQESDQYVTKLEGGRSALDFIEPIYHATPKLEYLAQGRNPVRRINPENPLLSLHQGVDHTLLNYVGKIQRTHIFGGRLTYARGSFFNDGHTQLYNRYAEPLKKAGFKINPIDPIDPNELLKALYPQTWQQRKLLQAAIREEKYEYAAKLRDSINQTAEKLV